MVLGLNVGFGGLGHTSAGGERRRSGTVVLLHPRELAAGICWRGYVASVSREQIGAEIGIVRVLGISLYNFHFHVSCMHVSKKFVLP